MTVRFLGAGAALAPSASVTGSALATMTQSTLD